MIAEPAPPGQDYEILAASLRSFLPADKALVERAASLCSPSDPEAANTLVRLAAQFGQDDALRSFIKQGLSVHHRLGHPLIVAADAGRDSTVNLLLNEEVPANVMGGEALIAGASSGSREVVALLLQFGCPATVQNQAPLKMAMTRGNVAMGEMLVKHGAEVEGCKADLVREACTAGGVQTVECLDFLRSQGVEMNLLETIALQKASWQADTVVVQQLLDWGADPAAEQAAALHCAASSAAQAALHCVTAANAMSVIELLAKALIARGSLKRDFIDALHDAGHGAIAWYIETESMAAV